MKTANDIVSKSLLYLQALPGGKYHEDFKAVYKNTRFLREDSIMIALKFFQLGMMCGIREQRSRNKKNL